MTDLTEPNCLPAPQSPKQSEGEGRLLQPLLNWARRLRRIRHDTRVFAEVPLNGRRIDVVTVTRTGVVTAYELKLGSVERALEQAWYNRRRLNRSYVVLGHLPREQHLDAARRFGIGVIVVTDESTREVVPSPYCYRDELATEPVLRRLNQASGRSARRV